MLEHIRTVDGENLLPIPADVLEAIGLQPGGQVEVTVVGQSLVVQMPSEEKPSESAFVQNFKGMMDKRRDAYQELA